MLRRDIHRKNYVKLHVFHLQIIKIYVRGIIVNLSFAIGISGNPSSASILDYLKNRLNHQSWWYRKQYPID